MRTNLVLLMLVAGMIAVAGCAEPLSPVTPSNGAWRFSGTISSTARVPIAGALLTVQEGPNKGTRAASDVAGRFLFERLEAARFKVVIEAPGFVSVTPIVDLRWDVDVDFSLRLPEESR